MKRQEVHLKVFQICCMGIAFFLPVAGRLVPVWIILLALNWLVSGKFLRLFRKEFYQSPQKNSLFFVVLYFLYLTGLLYTSNFEYAMFDLEIKMSLLIFPLIFSTCNDPPFSQEQLRYILGFFIAGCFTGSLILLIHAAFNQFNLHIAGSFYYTSLAWYFHSSYLAMYFTLAIIIINVNLFVIKKITQSEAVIFGLLFCFFSWMIILLSSKAGLIALGLVAIISVIIALFYAKNKTMAVLISSLAVFIFTAGWIFSPTSFSRFKAVEKAMVAKTDSVRVKPESNADRLAVWTTALDVIRSNPVFGVGTGDVKDALLNGYRQRDALPALQHRLNAHSQFLQTFVTLGVIGLLTFLLMFLIPGWYAFKRKNWLYLLFLLVFLLNCLTESMLEVQAGVVFYAFFNILLFTDKKKEGPGYSGALLNQNELVGFISLN